MASRIDYDALRVQTLGKGNDEAVTVNTRALIDKVLARYSGEWTTLRELIQNAADASSKQVKICLESLPSSTVPVPQSADASARLKHVLLHHTMKSTRIENDGEIFQANDWARLKKIAEGNPDETKIGAFGVGFYSVFSDCEEPFVSSGKEALAFYWKGDALFTKSLRLPDGQVSKTTFMLPNRNRDSPVPNLLSLCRFLASSLTFVDLELIELWLDEWNVMTLNKKNAPSLDIQIPKEVNRKTKDGLMQVIGVTREATQLDARWLKVVEWNRKSISHTIVDGNAAAVKGPHATQSLRSFFNRLAPSVSNSATMERLAKEEREVQLKISQDLTGASNATLFVHINRATIKTLVDQSFSAELERATKKPPPKNTTVSLLSASYDENMASMTSSSSPTPVASRVFDAFIPVNGKGKIFIGFTTNQTTGLNVHISTPSVIPTVERESIDLNNRFVRTWNVELLRIAGIVARISWGAEMADIQAKLCKAANSAGRKKIIRDDINAVLPETLFLHNSYTFSETTPSSEVGTLVEEAFWTCNQKVAIATLSSRGALPASQIRMEPEQLNFVEGVPSLPPDLAQVGLVKKLIEYGVITQITVSDIKRELESKALDATQLRQFLAWVLQKTRVQEIDMAMARSLLDAGVANDDEVEKGKLVILRDMKYFVNPSRIPVEMPVPPYVLPFKYTRDISRANLEILFEDLQMVPWLRWLVENARECGDMSPGQDITKSAPFACVVLAALSKQWDGLSQSSKATVTELLSSRTVMPTKLGMKKPAESYFPTVKLFDDLPVVTGLHSVKEKLLIALGVRKTIEIGVVFERLMNTSSTKTGIHTSSVKWSHVDLIKYLASVRLDIPVADINRLRSAKICPAETETLQPSNERYLVSELYQPDQSIRRLKLPTLQWPGAYRPESAEGKLLTLLGLRTHPTYQDLIHLISKAASNGDLALRDQALRYFVDHHHTNGYAHFDHASVTVQYLPIQGLEKKVAAPMDIFVNERASILGFDILRRDLQVHALKFGVRQDPPMTLCVNLMIQSPPQSKRVARDMFTYFAGRVSELNNEHTEALSAARIIPVLPKSGLLQDAKEDSGERETIVYTSPRLCFLGHGDSRYADIFDYVDFGTEANSFLLRVGSKHEPSVNELARRLVNEPAKLFSILGDTRYLELLRSIAENWAALKKDKLLLKDMRVSKCLLAYKEISSNGVNNDEEEEESTVKSWQLTSANEVVVIDDIITYNLFRETLLATPMEETLEAFYHSLGAPEVGALLEERQNIGSLNRDQSPALKLQRLLHERTRLFLHDYRPEAIKHNSNWVQKRLTVQCVQSISMTVSLKGYNVRRRQSRRAVILNDQPLLYVTADFDMLEVSQAMAPLLLQRVKPQSIFMLEMMLESSLNKLRSRGYNIQRILNEKAREARIAEETRKRQLAEEQLQIQEREAAWRQTQAENAARAEGQRQMPGIFPDSPNQNRPGTARDISAANEEPQSSKPRGFLSGLGKQFGFDNVKRSLAQNALSTSNNTRPLEPAQEDVPPPYSQEDSRKPSSVPQPETVTAPHRVQQNVMNAIQASRPHNSDSVRSQTSYHNVKETDTYCDTRPGHNITYVGESSGVRTFLSNDVVEKGITPEKFMAANASALTLFASVINECADSYALKRNTVHIYYDDTGSTIAFNTNKSLFFNYRYFENLHLPAVQQGKKAEAIVYWSVVMAHELAHNLVSDHSSGHSYWTETLIMQYFSKIALRVAQMSPDKNGGAASLPPDPLRPNAGSERLLVDID
ncbi:MAG: hypothetical protein Q9163_000682 [Psora crenata]